MTKPTLAFAISALFVVASAALEAQRPVNDRKLGQVGNRQLPMAPDDDDERKIVAWVRNTPAFNLDTALPPLELDRWLAAMLRWYDPNAAPLEWRLDRCEDFRSDLPDYAPELCVTAHSERISESDEKTLTLILMVGEWSQAGNGRSGWVMRPPAIRDFFVQTDVNSLDIRSLSELTTAFDVPVERWPTVEFDLAVEAVPPRALPGDIVTFRIQVRNTGKRDAPRAEIKFTASFGDTPDDARQYNYQWFPAIAAGGAVAVELPVGLPEGRGIFHASVNAFSSRKRFMEKDTSKSGIFL